jgi:hypothetical protein
MRFLVRCGNLFDREMRMNEEELRKLFGSATTATPEEKNFGSFWSSLIALNAGADSGKDMLAKTYLMRLITALLIRISLVASVWVFVFDVDKWAGMVLFACLTIMFGGVQPFTATASKGKPTK